MTKFNIPLSKPYITKNDVRSVTKCVSSTWISSKSPVVNEFEKQFAKKVSGTKYAASTNSCTSALFIALKSLGIEKGDEVILPTFTMIATLNAVKWASATPVLVDSTSKENWNISTSEITKKITNKTKVIIPVHIYGYPCDMKEIAKIAKKYNLFIIEDSAEAMGSIYLNKPCGSFSHISCFSLYANKVITTGNGGMLCTDNKNIYSFAKKISFFDFDEKEHFNHKTVGYNLVLSGLQASLGLSQLSNFQKQLRKRVENYELYKKYLEKSGKLKFIKPIDESYPNYWFPSIIFNTIKDKEKVQYRLNKISIETRDFFRPIHLQKVYSKKRVFGLYPNSEYFYKRGILLPSFYKLTKKEIMFICKIITNSLKN